MKTERVLRWWPLFLISSISLFMEVAVIRWLTSEIEVLAYFKNLTLLAAFLGLAIGFALVGKKSDYRQTFAPLWGLFAVLVIAVGAASNSRPIFYPGGGDEFIWNTLSTSFWISLFLFIATVLIFFLTCMFIFIPLGQSTGEEMALHPPVPAYIVNILASLAGVWVFSLLSYLQTPPFVWFIIGLAALGFYEAHRKKLARSAIAIYAITVIGIAIFGRGVVWSPYNRLTVSDLSYTDQQSGKNIPMGYMLNVQQTFFQTALDLSAGHIQNLATYPDVQATAQEAAASYDLAYQLAPPNSNVLIVGAGMGNDASAALRNGAGQVDAVEIDPAIISLGRKLHPEQPYSDPRVQAIVDDARSYFNKNSKKYDLISFGLLDSHTLLSGLSSVRLDSFVYTLNSFEQVKKHLAPGGVAVLKFATDLENNAWIEERLGRMLAEVFGANEISVYRDVLGTTFVAGPLTTAQISQYGLQAWQPNAEYDDLPLATDDWPYLYMRARRVPAGYWQTLLLIAIVCLALLGRSFPETLRPDWHFWLLGAAFLLIEFKSVTELALLFGTTWFVNSLAISGVLLMALAANLFVLKTQRVDLRLAYLLLFVSIVFGFIFPLESLAGLPAVLKAVVGMILLSLPLLFAGVIFSESLRRCGETARPLASNFSGSAVGGLLEYGSIWWGVKSLHLLGGLLYLAAMAIALRRRTPGK